MLPAQLECPFCHAAVQGALLVRATDAYAPAMRLYTSRCPECATPIEFQARAAHVEVGYTYWAGSMHFEAMAQLAVAGLRQPSPGVLALGSEIVFPQVESADAGFGGLEPRPETADLL